jgi:hypothetical protein
MALSMDEQRMLAEIERRLAAEDPGLAARLSAFRRPGPTAKLRSPRGRIIGSLFTVAVVAVVSMMVYAMIPFRAHNAKSTFSPTASRPAASAPRVASSGGIARHSVPATTQQTTTQKTTTAKTTTLKTASPKADSRPSGSAHTAATSRTSDTAKTKAPANTS